MKKLFILIMLFLVVGCASSLPNKTYYQLKSDFSDSHILHSHKVKDVILINNIQVANYLDKNGIVYQTDDMQYVTANNNLWLTPLSDQIKQRLVQDLAVLMPNYLLTTQPTNNPKATLTLYIDSFHGVYTGDAVIKGYWVITTVKDVIIKHFDYRLRLTDDGYLAVVKALSQGWQEEEIDLVKSMQF